MRSRVAIQSHPVHPMLVAFPIALWVMGFIFNIIGVLRDSRGLWSAGFDCVVAGCVTAVLAAVPGAIDWLTVVPPRSSAKPVGCCTVPLTCLRFFSSFMPLPGRVNRQSNRIMSCSW